MKKWLKRLGLALGVLVLLLVVLLIVVTRPGFINSVIVPRVGKAIQTDIRIGALEFSPFSRLQAGDVRVGPDDAPLVQGKLMRVRYSLLSALAGRVRVDEVRLDDTAIHVVKRADGSMNLPVFPPSKPDEEDDDDDDDPSDDEPSGLSVADVRLSGLSFIYEQRQGPGQEPILVKLSKLSLEVPEWAGGKEAKLKLGGQIDELTMGGVSGVKGTLSGDCRVGLWPSLEVSAVDLLVRITFSQGSANALELAGREVRLDVQMTAERGALVIRRVAVSESMADRPEAALALSGRVQWNPANLQLDVVADPIESAVFTIVGALLGDVSFGAPSGTYRAKVAVQSPGRWRHDMQRNVELPWAISATGRLDLRALSPRSEKWGLRDLAPFDASVEHDVTWHTDSKTLEVRRLAAHAGTPGRELLSAELSQPITLDFAGKTPAVAQAETVLALKVRGVALSSASPFLPPGLPLSVAAGTVDADAELSVAQQGAAVSLSATVKVTDALLADPEGGRGKPFTVEARVGAKVTDQRRVEADMLTISLRPQGEAAAELKASGRFDLDQGGEGTASLSGMRESLLALLPPRLGAALPLERFALDGEVRWQAGKGFQPLSTTAGLRVTHVRLRGQEGADELEAGLTLQAEMTPGEVAVRAMALDASIGGQPTVQVAAQGTFGLTQAAGPVRTLTVSSDLIDIDRFMAFAKPLLSTPPAASAAPTAAAPPAAAPAVPAPPAAAPALPPLNLAVNLDLRKVVYNGRTATVTGAVTLADAAELKSLVLRLPSGSITVNGLLKPEGPDWRTRLTVFAAGEALSELAASAGKKLPGNPLQGTVLLLRLDGTAAPDASRLRLDTMEVRLSQAERDPMLGVALAKPLVLMLPKGGAMTWTDTELSVTATKFPLAMVAVALPADSGMTLDGGMLDAALTVGLKGEALGAAVSGTFTVADLAGRRGEQVFSALRVEGTLQAQAEGKDRVSVSKLEGSVSAAGNRALTFSATAVWDRAKGTSANLELSADVPVALKAAGLGGPAFAKVQTLTLTVKANAQQPPENGPLRATLDLAATDMRLTDAEGKALPPWAARVAGTVVLHAGRTELDALTIHAQVGEKALANLELSGNVLPSPGRSDLKLNGDLLDITGLLRVAVGGTPPADTAKKEKKEKKEAPPPPKEPAVEPGPFSTGTTAVVTLIDLKNIIYGEIKSDVACNLSLENSVLTVGSIKGVVSGGPLSGEVKANLAVQGLDYSMNLTLGALDLAPILKTFAASLAPSIQGTLTGVTLDLAGQGITMPSLQKTLHGRLETGARNLIVQGLSWQATLAQKSGVKELERLQLAQVEVKTRIQGGKILVDTCQETSPEHTVKVSGQIGLDESLALDLEVGVGGTLQAQLSQNAAGGAIMNYLVKQGDHLVTPVPVPIKGTISKPRVDEKRFLSSLAKTAAPALINNVLQDQAGKLLQGQAGDGAKPTVEGVLKGLLQDQGGKSVKPTVDGLLKGLLK